MYILYSTTTTTTTTKRGNEEIEKMMKPILEHFDVSSIKKYAFGNRVRNYHGFYISDGGNSKKTLGKSRKQSVCWVFLSFMFFY